MTGEELTVTQKVKAGLLAPSTTLELTDVLSVYHFIFGLEDSVAFDLRYILKEIMTPTSSQEDIRDAQEEGKAQPSKAFLILYTTIFTQQNVGTMHLGSKASGTPQVGDYMLCVRDIMKHSYQFMVDHQFPVQTSITYYADCALVALDAGGCPLYVVEYKPKIPAGLEDVEPSHLSEVFLQAFYLRKMYTHNILHCLTDLEDFHYFLMTDNQSSKKLKIERCITVHCNITNEVELLDHLRFVCNLLKCTLSLP